MNQAKIYLPLITSFSSDQKKLVKQKILGKYKEHNMNIDEFKKYDTLYQGFVKSQKYRYCFMMVLEENYKELVTPYKNIKTVTYKPTEIEKVAIMLSAYSYSGVYARKDYKKYEYIKEESSKNIAVYRYKSLFSDNIFIAYRGTNDREDIIPDMYIVRNKHEISNRFDAALDKYDDIKKKYPKAKIHVTGHSLGGALAIWVLTKRKSCYKGYVFNPGYNGYLTPKINLNHDNLKVFMVKGDIICNTIFAMKSEMKPAKKNWIILAGDNMKPLKNHSMNNFTKLV